MPSTDHDEFSTLSDIPSGRRRGVRIRRCVLVVMVVVVGVAASGLLGVHTRSVSATAGGWTLAVDYAGVARAGLDVPLRITVTHPGGFDDEITLAVDRDYLVMFEQQGFYPDASASNSRGDDVLLTFDAPPSGAVFVVDFDAYVQPANQAGERGTVAVVQGSDRLVEVDFRTVLFP